MSYITGTATNSASLISLIQTQCVAAGWTLSGTWLYKGSSFVSITAPDTYTVQITGANNSTGTLTPSGLPRSIALAAGYWPCTYHLQINTNPDVVVLTVNYLLDRCQMLMFGNIVKVNDAAFVGGNFCWATCGSTNLLISDWDTTSTKAENNSLQGIDINGIYSGMGYLYQQSVPSIPFTIPTTTCSYDSGLHAEIDGAIWPSATSIYYTGSTISSLFRGPNTYNSQALLVPMNLQIAMTNNLFSYLGFIEHIRLIRIDNYNIDDIITINPDQWRVYPWRQKDTFYRNTNTPNTSNLFTSGAACSGTIGYAVRYTT